MKPKKSRKRSTIITSRSAWKTKSRPRTAGRVLSLADKWDTLVECFKVGMTPTGSRDPFGLRRAAQGIVRIIVEGKVKIRLPGISASCREFLRDRVEYYFRDVRGFAYDEVRACMAAGWTDLLDLESRLKRVQAVRTTPDFEPIAASFKRIKNILKQADSSTDSTFHAQLLEPGPERDLYDEIPRHQGPAARIAHRLRCGPKSISSSTRCSSMRPTPTSGATGLRCCRIS